MSETVKAMVIDAPEEEERDRQNYPLKGALRGDKVVVPDGEAAFYDRGGFGDPTDSGLELCPEEALFLVEKGKLEVLSGEEKISFDGLLNEFKKFYEDIYIRYQVFRNLRERGLVVRSGLKYGTHFRVYNRGVRPRKGMRAPWEHAKFIVHSVSEGQVYAVNEMARFVRLSHSVKKKLWLAIVDGEGDVTYYQTIRVTP